MFPVGLYPPSHPCMERGTVFLHPCTCSFISPTIIGHIPWVRVWDRHRGKSWEQETASLDSRSSQSNGRERQAEDVHLQFDKGCDRGDVWVQSRQNEVRFDAYSLFLHSCLCLAFRKPRSALNETLVWQAPSHQHHPDPVLQGTWGTQAGCGPDSGLLVLLLVRPFLQVRSDHPEYTPPCPCSTLWIHRSQNCPQMASSLEVDSTGLYAWGSQGRGRHLGGIWQSLGSPRECWLRPGAAQDWWRRWAGRRGQARDCSPLLLRTHINAHNSPRGREECLPFR